ncbi:hypothetical protein SCHPADRAFT_362603 [Schizopora paradoxa]|uniref:Uncharacterized protein n=1 Tax=Schizopora paradoxa TaxID=27342 RepID=A0A0H2RND4_9AGAM|nr:hypothetical protein SCHPADRAFT_362603 [Schizopora paradoxa]
MFIRCLHTVLVSVLTMKFKSSSGPLNSPNLVGTLQYFSNAVDGEDKTSIIVPNNLGLNPTLNKQLKLSVSAVSPKVVAVRKSFEVVGGIVERFSTDGKDAKLRECWKLIEKEYMDFLQESSQLAIHGAEIIHDFLESVLPYLNSSGNLDEKCEELKAYCGTLQEGENQARKFSKTLESVATQVVDFREKWQHRVEEAVGELKDSIKRLEDDIRELGRSIHDVTGNVSELKSPKSNKTEKEKLKKEQQHESLQRQRADKQVGKYSENITSNTDGLRIVWNLIYDDLYLIETHLRVTASGKGQALFQQRLAKLPDQYRVLKDALERYSLALSMEPCTSERSFFGRLRSVFH